MRRIHLPNIIGCKLYHQGLVYTYILFRRNGSGCLKRNKTLSKEVCITENNHSSTGCTIGIRIRIRMHRIGTKEFVSHKVMTETKDKLFHHLK